MNREDYESKMKALNEEAQLKRKDLMWAYALANSPYTIGDVIEDHMSIIRIENILMYIGLSNVPECKYIGPKLKKNLSPFKSGENDVIYQYNVKRKIEE